MTSLAGTQNDSNDPNGVISLAPKKAVAKGSSNLKRSLRTLRRHRMAMFGAVLLVVIFLYVLIGSFVFPESASNAVRTEIRLSKPIIYTWVPEISDDPILRTVHGLVPPRYDSRPFGTDRIGRDIFVRTIYGGQISLFIGVTAVVVQIFVGALIGLLAGYAGGVIDSLLMRFTDAMLSIPQLFLALIAVKSFAEGVGNFRIFGREFSSTMVVLILVIGLTSWMRVARIVRSVVLSVKAQEYITAARSLGLKSRRILLRHVLPNCLAPIIVSATLGVANAILLEAYLGFLGLGVRAPTATWGNIINEAREFIIQGEWYYWFFPAIFINLTVLGINFLGDGLRDAFDPKSLK
jgi:peptide/nickel transport system permease protein